MQTDELLDTLGYGGSSNFIQGRELEEAPAYSHIFRRARGEDNCRLVGVYALKETGPSGKDEGVPLVYVCEAESREHADLIHRRVWNQNVVPFLLVRTPRIVRLYSGFRYAQGKGRAVDSADAGVLDALIEFNEIATKLRAFRGEAIDNGTLWREWGAKVTPETRVDWKLLDHLEALDKSLQADGLTRITSHALIGKYVYLRYLRDRGILSDWKLAEWGIDPDAIFTGNASKDALRKLLERLAGWLNGSVFPLELDGKGSPEPHQIRRVAGIFQGNDPSGQLHLDFDSYDFSYIPVETISVIYEQFLHSTGKGRQAGAYYTPIPLVNYMLEELNDRRQLQVGMKVFDPACGSGAFLVQCYRWLVERELSKSPDHRLPPVKLRSLLEEHIFGLDDDEDACRVAQLSLTLTLLDYIDPPDLQENPDFRIPDILNKNIFKGDFFDFPPAWRSAMDGAKFDWIVGNPPWKDLSKDHLEKHDEPAWNWMVQHRKDCPTGGNQLAEAFSWKVMELAAEDGVIGLVLPAMTLFKDESKRYRKAFFRTLSVWCVVNFSNLAEVLFAGRARKPAAVFFYSLRESDASRPGETILTYAPLVANQEANRPVSSGAREQTWSIVVNASEVREIPLARAASGERLPWKIAMWGSTRDQRLLDYLDHRYPSLADLEREMGLHIHPGIEIRSKHAAEPVEPVKELEGKNLLIVEALRNRGRMFSFPAAAFEEIEPDRAYVRSRRAEVPLTVCRPPHIILDAGRRYAVFSDEFIAVPPRQIGIAGDEAHSTFLIALSLFLNSKFATYHQFLHSPQWGVQGGRATLRTLKRLPVPLGELSEDRLSEWRDLHKALVRSWPSERKKGTRQSLTLFDDEAGDLSDYAEDELGAEAAALLGQLNELVYKSLNIKESERYLIEDLVDVKLQLIDGKVTKDALRYPTLEEIGEYAAVLQGELDDFLAEDEGLRHRCSVVHDNISGMVQIELLEAPAARMKPGVHRASDATAAELEKARKELRREYGQWLYFDRNLRIYKGNRTFILKPFQRLHWLRSQALMDADEIIAETLAATEG